MKLIKFFLIISIFAVPSFSQSAGTAASVSEFEVNGLKVIFKRRTSSPTVSVGLFVRGGVRECGRIGADDIRLQFGADQIFAQALQARFGFVDRGNVCAGGGELQRLAAGRCAEIEHTFAANVAE